MVHAVSVQDTVFMWFAQQLAPTKQNNRNIFYKQKNIGTFSVVFQVEPRSYSVLADIN